MHTHLPLAPIGEPFSGPLARSLKVDDYEHADALVFDLDPGSGIEWQIVTETALGLRELLKSKG